MGVYIAQRTNVNDQMPTAQQWLKAWDRIKLDLYCWEAFGQCFLQIENILILRIYIMTLPAPYHKEENLLSHWILYIPNQKKFLHITTQDRNS